MLGCVVVGVGVLTTSIFKVESSCPAKASERSTNKKRVTYELTNERTSDKVTSLAAHRS